MMVMITGLADVGLKKGVEAGSVSSMIAEQGVDSASLSWLCS